MPHASSGEEKGKGSRREFLKSGGAMPVAALAAVRTSEGADAKLPQVRLGRHSISRLICGANPFGGWSHSSSFLSKLMVEYYTPERVLKTLRRCQEVGVNCWQSGSGSLELYRRFIAEGGKMRFLVIEPGEPEKIPALAEGGCIGIAFHGEQTDRLFKQGQLDQIQDYLKRVRDAGLLVGVSTHMPAVIDTIESKGWDVDYYMTCVYERHRSAEALEKLLGQAPIPVGEVYLPLDPPRMFKMIQQTSKPCLAFKILAAGRFSSRQELVEKAFRETFAGIKPTDAVIVGIYDRYSDQQQENAEYVRRYGSAGA
jgi:hypothetical protein